MTPSFADVIAARDRIAKARKDDADPGPQSPADETAPTGI